MKISEDGLIKSHSQKGDGFIDIYNKICLEQAEREIQWIAFLRQIGVKMAHPDDGWVNRKENSVNPTYPQFDDGAEVGDVICLGYPFDETTRLVRVTKIEASGFIMQRYFFENISQGKNHD